MLKTIKYVKKYKMKKIFEPFFLIYALNITMYLKISHFYIKTEKFMKTEQIYFVQKKKKKITYIVIIKITAYVLRFYYF